MREIPQQRKAVGDFRQGRQVLANLHAGHDRVDRRKLATKLLRRVRLQVERVDCAQATLQEEDDQRNVILRAVALLLRGRIGGQNLRQADGSAERPHQADSQHVAAGLTVTEASLTVRHECILRHAFLRFGWDRSCGMPASEPLRHDDEYEGVFFLFRDAVTGQLNRSRIVPLLSPSRSWTSRCSRLARQFVGHKKHKETRNLLLVTSRVFRGHRRWRMRHLTVHRAVIRAATDSPPTAPVSRGRFSRCAGCRQAAIDETARYRSAA